MDKQLEFLKQIQELSDLGKEKGGKLTQEEVHDFFKGSALSEEQFRVVYDYLFSQKIAVAGYEPTILETTPKEKEKTKSIPYEEEEQNFLDQYEEDLQAMAVLTSEEIEQLAQACEKGDKAAGDRLSHGLLRPILELAKTYAHKGVLIGDIVQEGNLGLVLALAELSTKDPGETYEKFIMDAVKNTIHALVMENVEEKNSGSSLVDKMNQLVEVIDDLNKDLGGDVTLSDIVSEAKISVDEIEDLFRIAGEDLGGEKETK